MSLIDLDVAQLIFDKKMEQLLNDPILAPFKDKLRLNTQPISKSVRVTMFGGPSKRSARSDMCMWLNEQLGRDKTVSTVYDLAGPGASQLTELWLSDLRRANLFSYQSTKIVLIDRNEEYIHSIDRSTQYLKAAIVGDIWKVLPPLLKGRGARGNTVISLDFCGTLHGAQAGDNSNPDCIQILPQLFESMTGNHTSVCIYLTVAIRGEGGIEQLKSEMEQLGTVMSVHGWTCSAQQMQSYFDTHPMMSGMYLMRKN